MNKIISSVAVGSIFLGGLLYVGSQKVLSEVVDTKLSQLQAYGMTVEEREHDKKGDHFVLALTDIHKFSELIPKYKSLLLTKDKSLLKELKIGVDITSSLSDISLDIYPVSFPTKGFSAQTKEIIANHISQKTLMMHVNYSPLTSQFEGNLKGIDETIDDKLDVKLLGLNFDGISSDDKLTFNSRLNTFDISLNHKSILKVESIDSKGTYAGAHWNVINSDTDIDKIFINFPGAISAKEETVSLEDSHIQLTSTLKNNLFGSRIHTNINTVNSTLQNIKMTLKNVICDYGIENLNFSAYNKLSTLINSGNLNSTQMKEIVSDILKDGIMLNIYKIGVSDIAYDNQQFKGFSLQGNASIVNNPKMMQIIQTNPLAALSLLKAEAKIEISDELFAPIQESPKGAALMGLPSKEENNNKIYNIEFKDSQLKVNNVRVM